MKDIEVGELARNGFEKRVLRLEYTFLLLCPKEVEYNLPKHGHYKSF
jgi:hypothetical protein